MKITIEGENLKISDHYHTMEEIYEHRTILFMALCRAVKNKYPVWISKKHSDGSKYDDWFIMGINTEPGKQITYHLPMIYWSQCLDITNGSLELAPKWDGHTSEYVLKRIGDL